MGTGNLYRLSDNEFIVSVNYQLLNDRTAANWWGELTPNDYTRFDDGDMFMIELEDKHRSKCHLKKKVNRAVSGLPPRYVYHVTGFSPIGDQSDDGDFPDREPPAAE